MTTRPTTTLLGAALAVVSSAALAGCQFTASTHTGPPPRPIEEQPPAPAAAMPPAVVQLYSPPLYRSFVSRSVPYKLIADRANNAALNSLLRVRESDILFDDYYERRGTIVMVGWEHGGLVGFTTRYSVDIQYPDDDLIQDAAGKPDFRDPRLILSPRLSQCAKKGARWCTLEFRLHPMPGGEIRWNASNTAYYRTFGDNDAVLVYFPRTLAERLAEAGITPIGLESPSDEIARTLSDSTEILGKDFVLISPESLELLRKKAGTQSVLATYGAEVVSWAAGLLGASTVVRKLMSSGMDYFAMDRRKLQAAITFKLVADYAAQEILPSFDFHASIAPDESGQMRMPPLHLVEVPYEHSQDAASFMYEIVGQAQVEMVLFGANRRAAERGMLFVPARHVNLNYELVRNGLARLALDHAGRKALRVFPEFADAAADALEEGAGFAAEWRDDTLYVRAVQAARASLR